MKRQLYLILSGSSQVSIPKRDYWLLKPLVSIFSSENNVVVSIPKRDYWLLKHRMGCVFLDGDFPVSIPKRDYWLLKPHTEEVGEQGQPASFQSLRGIIGY